MGKLGNILTMLKILETGRKYSVKELAEKIEVTPRIIKGYKLELEKAGIYIDTIHGCYGGYVYNNKTNYDISFNIKDVNILEKILTITKKDTKEYKDLERFLEKIKTIVIYSNKIDETKKDGAIDIKLKYNVVSKALKENSNITLEYKNKIKTIVPHNISFYKDYIYVTGYSIDDKDLRTYNLSEINFK